jgi:hypothetical protein
LIITIIISLAFGLLGTLAIEFFINHARDKQKNQKENVYKSFDIILSKITEIRRLDSFLMEMIDTKESVTYRGYLWCLCSVKYSGSPDTLPLAIDALICNTGSKPSLLHHICCCPLQR